MENHEENFAFEIEEPWESGPRKSVLFNAQFFLRLLRWVGAVIIVVSAASFLFKYWTPGSDLQRYLFLLGFTVVLSVSGLFCGLYLRESKGARTLLGLTLAVTPINFAVMSALLYSCFSWDGLAGQLPGYATWIAGSPFMAVAATLGGLVVLAPLGHLSFMTLGRRHARLFSALFLVGNLALLLPTRQPMMMTVLFCGLVVLLIAAEIRLFGRDPGLRAADGILIRALLWVPVLIVSGRSCYFYAPEQLFVSVLLAAIGALGFFVLPHLSERLWLQKLFQGFGALLASGGWMNVVEVLFRFTGISYRYEIVFMLLPLAGLFFLLAKFAHCGGNNYRRIAAIIAVGSSVLNLLAYPGVATVSIGMSVSVLVLLGGYLLEQKIMFCAGLLGALVAVGYQFRVLFYHFSLGGWSSLMVIGVLIIVVASVIERSGGLLKGKLTAKYGQFKRWTC